jgi:hypothetical protein
VLSAQASDPQPLYHWQESSGFSVKIVNNKLSLKSILQALSTGISLKITNKYVNCSMYSIFRNFSFKILSSGL